MGETSAVVIEELSGQKRKLELRGPALPFPGATWKGKQKLVTTWNNGNSEEATQHVLGAEDPPVEWEGLWKRTQMGHAPSYLSEAGGSPSPIVSPSFLRDTVDDIARKGQRLRVTWSVIDSVNGANIGRPLTREGRISDYEFPHDRMTDIHWKITFEWVGRGEQPHVVSTRDPEFSTAALQSAANEFAALAIGSRAIRDARGLRLSAANSATSLSLGQLENLTQAPNKLLTGVTRSIQRIVNQVKQVATIINKARKVPLQLANTTVALARNTSAIVNQFTDEMSRRPPELNSYKAGLADLARSTSHFGKRVDAATIVSRRAQELRQRLAPAQRGSALVKAKTLQAVHVVKPGQTMSLISSIHYGVPDHAVDICRANKLKWTTVVPPSNRPTLLIPVLTNLVGT